MADLIKTIDLVELDENCDVVFVRGKCKVKDLRKER